MTSGGGDRPLEHPGVDIHFNLPQNYSKLKIGL